jgi:transcriptional regulator with XRE-family HTH domain
MLSVFDYLSRAVETYYIMCIIICMSSPERAVSKLIKSARIELGLTQSDLAHRAQISLPSIQNIEADNANPSAATLKAVLDVLGYRIRFEAVEVDWDALVLCGAPLTSKKQVLRYPGISQKNLLIQELPKACMTLAGDLAIEDRERKLEAVQAMILALKSHFPSFYKTNFQSCPIVLKCEPKEISGKLLKLRRQAIERLAKYL